MKRAIALLLAAVMAFALCGCGKIEPQQIVYQVVEGSVAEASDPIEKPQDDYIQILDVRLKPYKDGQYWMDIKFKCLYPKDKHEVYPSGFDINYNLLDKDGVIIKKELQQMTDVSCGDVAWSCAYDSQRALRLLINPDEVDSVKIVSYCFWGNLPAIEDYYFSDPIIYKISDLEVVA